MSDEIKMDAGVGAVFEVNTERRVIKGLAVPYGKAAMSRGQLYQFTKGALKWSDPSRVKLLIGHNFEQAVGYATELEETDQGLVATFKVARGVEGDKALSFAEDRVWDGLSVGLGVGGKFTAKGDVAHAVTAPLAEISLTPMPAFEDARLISVAAQADNQEGTMTMDPCTKCGVAHAQGVSECDAATLAAFEAENKGPDFSAISDAIKAGFEGLTNAEGREVIQAGAQLQVEEPAPYRFDGIAGEHDFSTDLIAYGRDRDAEAGERVMKFMAEQFTPKFDVDTGNVTTLNPSRQRPDMYVDERRFRTPLYDALHKGAITDMTPFLFPKFNSAAGLVADHVEGQEPTPGSFTATNQTVTPSAVSGKVEITREVWDQGGNPQVSGLIWNKMVQHYYSALEVKAKAVLDAASPTGIPLTTGATDDDLVNELEAAIADLNFVAGGNTFDYAASHANLYKRLAAAVDSTGRKLLPIIGATNANGQARSKFYSIDVAGVEFVPVPSLGAASTATSSSYLIDTSSVHLWNSAPQRLEFQYRVAYVDLAIWGYVATAISDLAGVREVTYDPTV
jgi:HK97 family phage prohead protease